ncbi:MAG: Xaa-Pro peptidase family protein [Gammaproteobacteria bacterium]|nr:Xaa-Pro peptidase family protein [Gammaproteobacteria bacterium]
MKKLSRRTFLGMTSAAAALAAAASAETGDQRAATPGSLTEGVQPITAQEHAARIAKLQSLMRKRKVAALLVESGSTLEYFTGIRWRRSERTTAALIRSEGEVVVVTPFFEEPSIRETLKISADVRTWNEDESPFDLIASALRERLAAYGALAVEDTTRYFIIDRVGKAAGTGPKIVSGEGLVNTCRMIKSSAELALMQAANDVTFAALSHVHGRIEAGMSGTDIMKMMVEATEALGGSYLFALVLLNEASAYPHGTEKPQAIRNGSVVLIDTGCSVHGYQSDISRSWVFGEPSPRQRDVWDMVKRGQEITLETAKIGIPVGAIDKAVRDYYEGRGWSKDYGLPGTSHRTGHGIGLDGHEPPYLMRADTTPLEPGMCFSDEPGIYIPGEFGIRMEDCWYMTEAGPKLFTPLAKSIDDPI